MLMFFIGLIISTVLLFLMWAIVYVGSRYDK